VDLSILLLNIVAISPLQQCKNYRATSTFPLSLYFNLIRQMALVVYMKETNY